VVTGLYQADLNQLLFGHAVRRTRRAQGKTPGPSNLPALLGPVRTQVSWRAEVSAGDYQYPWLAVSSSTKQARGKSGRSAWGPDRSRPMRLEGRARTLRGLPQPLTPSLRQMNLPPTADRPYCGYTHYKRLRPSAR
jgi:hypothetical protein